MHQMGMVKICMVLATLMRHRDSSVAQNATKPVIQLPHIRSVRSQINYKHGMRVIVVSKLQRYKHKLKCHKYKLHAFVPCLCSMYHVLFSFLHILTCSHCFHTCSMVQPHFSLLDTYYDKDPRAHLTVDNGDVSDLHTLFYIHV